MARYREAKFPLGEKAHLPRDISEAAQFASDNESNFLKLFWENEVDNLQEKAGRRQKATKNAKDPSRQNNGRFGGN